MSKYFKGPLFGSICGLLLLSATPSDAVALSGVADLNEVSSVPQVLQVSHGVPTGARCVKWTRRWNTRHGVGHRRCVQWR